MKYKMSCVLLLLFSCIVTGIAVKQKEEINTLKDNQIIIMPEVKTLEQPKLLLPVVEEVECEYLGEFKLTGYCNCEICCGIWAGGPTYSGVMPTANHTIAVDKDIIPIGTHVIIDGIEYVAEDTGSAIIGNRIDVYCNSHEECYNPNYNKTTKVYKIKEPNC